MYNYLTTKILKGVSSAESPEFLGAICYDTMMNWNDTLDSQILPIDEDTATAVSTILLVLLCNECISLCAQSLQNNYIIDSKFVHCQVFLEKYNVPRLPRPSFFNETPDIHS